MLSREKGAFNLNYSYYVSFFYVKVKWTEEGRLIDDIAEGFSHSNSIFCLPTAIM